MDTSIRDLFTDRKFNAGRTYAGKRLAARRAAELLAEDPSLTAQGLVDLLRGEADAVEADFEQVRDDS